MQIASTPRTTLHELQRTDAEFMLELMNTAPWLRFIGDRNVHSATDVEAYLDRSFLQTRDNHGFGYYVARLNGEVPLGICGFLQKTYLDHPDFGFALLPQFHGQGYGTEVGQAVLSFGTQQFQLSAIDAVTVAENTPSIRLLTKLSFERVGEVKPEPTETPLELYRLTVPEQGIAT